MSVKMDFLYRALHNEQMALNSSQAAYNHFLDTGNERMAEGLKEIMEDESRHVGMIMDMLNRKQGNTQ